MPFPTQATGELSEGGFSLALRCAGYLFISAAILWNAFILVDAVSFDLGETMTPACRSFRAIAGFDLVILAFAAQAVFFGLLVAVSRSWWWALPSVFPFWGFFSVGVCTGIV